ncbi:hypothetical protein WR25_15936 isoform C [Diploscapter pachys]|uniref:Chondroitin proteoglycan 4 domain-containing protein n=2 Tax=Diploscapter pachys TaxID=2018661 RepID=A0A2A2JMD7_9BILA|nr:hypothetical protein WR25_15936 isoform C [Diploscapter pachys]
MWSLLWTLAFLGAVSPNVVPPKSPLDQPAIVIDKNFPLNPTARALPGIEGFDPTKWFAQDELEIAGAKEALQNMSPCVSECSRGMLTALDLFMGDTRMKERFDHICKEYIASVICIEKEPCQNDTFWYTFTAGMRYMCIEQSGAFGVAMDCIDDSTADVQDQCDDQCEVKRTMMEYFMRSDLGNAMMTQLLKLGQDMGQRISAGQTIFPAPESVSFADISQQFGKMSTVEQQRFAQQLGDPNRMVNGFKDFSRTMCSLSECVLECARTAYNRACNSTAAGELLSEMFVRPIAKGQQAFNKHVGLLRPFINYVSPTECNFLFNEKALRKHRIDDMTNSALQERHGSLDLKSYQSELTEAEVEEQVMKPILASLAPVSGSLLPINIVNDAVASSAGMRAMPSGPRPTGAQLEAMIDELYDGNQMSNSDAQIMLKSAPTFVEEEFNSGENPSTCNSDIPEEKCK